MEGGIVSSWLGKVTRYYQHHHTIVTTNAVQIPDELVTLDKETICHCTLRHNRNLTATHATQEGDRVLKKCLTILVITTHCYYWCNPDIGWYSQSC